MTETPISKKILQYGLTEVYSAPSPKVDIVLVHGLNGHPHHTWATHKPEFFWPSDLLPSALEEQRVRILTYGYDANVAAFTDGTSKDKIHNHAEHLAARLSANRALKKATERPIIFVAHSLGGLVVKRCLVYCKNVQHAHTERLRSIFVSTYAIIFLGTPHNGSDLAKWGSMLESIASAVMPKKFFESSPQLVKALKTQNETLQNINRLFGEIIDRYRIYYFHESKPTDLKGTREFIVDEDSAAPMTQGAERMGIERDHSHICKFESEAAPGYDVFAEALQRYAQESERVIPPRWLEERRIRYEQRSEAARELMPDGFFQMTGSGAEEASGHTSEPRLDKAVSSGATPQRISAQEQFPYEVEEMEEREAASHTRSFIQPSKQIEAPPIDNDLGVPLLIAPLGFRHNSLFFGFQFELDQLHQKLTKEKQKASGTTAVVLWGPAGCGKTHLAREYVFHYREDYPNGIFWVDCKSEEAIHKSFWDIAQATVLLGAADHADEDPNWDDASKFLETVRSWFQSKENWLIVFDGVSFDTEEDIRGFMRFIPDHQQTNIIYTSVDRTLGKRQRLLYPTAIKVAPMSIEDARLLLYSGLGIEEPTKAQELKATELVKHYECLPLAIHAMGHVLDQKGKSLEKYHIGSSDTSARLAEPYIEIMDLLFANSHPEAVALINIISFFGHNIPVAMLSLGRDALRDFNVEIRSVDRKGSTRKDLDNTIFTLIRYGLAERTLQSYSRSADGSLRTGSVNDAQGESSPEVTQSEHSREEETSKKESSIKTGSTRSETSTIEIVRVHTVIQSFCRDELKLKDKESFYWYLTIAVSLFCTSYKIAHERIRAREGHGLVRDYREYETHAAKLYSYFPKDKYHASVAVANARHDIRKAHRAIKREIENRSPTHSFKSTHQMVQISIFERTSSTSSGGPETPLSLSRASTWTLDAQDKSDSPTQIKALPELPLDNLDSGDESWHAGSGYESGYDDSRSSVLTERRPSVPEEERDPDTVGSARRQSFLDLLRPRFGKPRARKGKDTGEFRPMPAPPSLTHTNVRAETARTASLTDSDDRIPRPISASSEAEASLAAMHSSNPPGARGGRIRSPSRPSSEGDATRRPLGNRSPNPNLSPLAAEFLPSDKTRTFLVSAENKSASSTAHHSRQSTSSSLNKELPLLPIEENISVARRRIPPFNMPRALPSANPYGQSDILPQSSFLPTGYTSQPMSRDPSNESAYSLTSAPPAVGTTMVSPPPAYATFQPTNATPKTLASSAPSTQLRRLGNWAQVGPIVPLQSITTMNEIRPGAVQFGQASPVDLGEARLRADEYARRLVPFQRGDFRPAARQVVVPAPARMREAGFIEESTQQDDELHGLGLHFDGNTGHS